MEPADRPDGVQLVIPADTASLAVARQVVAGLGEAFELEELEAADLKLIVSEACSNAVRHAYREPGEADEAASHPKPIEVEMRREPKAVVVIVRDQGTGFVPAVGTPDSLGLGIPLMASVTRSLTLSARQGGGVELRAEVPVARSSAVDPAADDSAEFGIDPAKLNGNAAYLTVGGGVPMRPLLARMIGICAARAGLTIDQLSDTLLLSDAVAEGDLWTDLTEVVLREEDERAVLTIGPLIEGGGEQLISGLEIPGVGSLAKLAGELSVETREVAGQGQAEFVKLVVASKPAG